MQPQTTTKIDMSWGSPIFLTPYWQVYKHRTARNLGQDLAYNFGSRDSLKELIKSLHRQENNAVVDKKHIVVGAGATSIILELLRVLKNRTKATSAWATPPHFSRFPLLAEFAGLEWEKKRNSLIITTIPNNPDGSLVLHKNTGILDLTYNWPQYIDKPKKYDHPIMVFSLSKATGHASTRIGWVVLEDPTLAAELELQIEHSTSGLSVDAQLAAEDIIKSQLNSNFTVFEDGKRTLQDRQNLIQDIEHLLPFKILTVSGMFLWAKGECPNQIIGLDGRSLCGPKGTFRLNIGCSSKNFVDFYNLFAKNKLKDIII